MGTRSLKNCNDQFPFEELGIEGRLIAHSKSRYRERHPGNIVMFNANIFTEEDGRVWYGDLDITWDASVIQKVCDKLDQVLYVVPEMYGRFGHEERPFDEIKEDAAVVFNPGEGEYQCVVYGDNIEVKKVSSMYTARPAVIGWKPVKIENHE